MNYFLKQLKAFVTVAQERSFGHTEERISLSQSAVSYSVKELENHTGVCLLNRTTREMMLTDAEQQSALYLGQLLDELNNALRDTGRMGQQSSGKAQVAANRTISAHFIPQYIAEGRRHYPDIQFVLHDRPRQRVVESIHQGDVDFGIVIDSGSVGDLQSEAILSEPFFLLCYRDSALAVEDYVPWQTLQGAKLVLQNYASGNRSLINAVLVRDGIQANIMQETEYPATLFPMVATGISISILPTLALSLPESNPLVVRRITPIVERQLMLVRRESRPLFTAAEALWDVVRDQGDALMTDREGDPLYQVQISI